MADAKGSDGQHASVDRRETKLLLSVMWDIQRGNMANVYGDDRWTLLPTEDDAAR